MSWFQRVWAWLRTFFGVPAPTVRIDLVPEGECAHTISPAEVMKQLDRSAHDPLKRIEIYASICEACRLAVQEEYVFDKAGGALAQVDEEFHAAGFETVKQLICGHTICVEEYARRLKLCYDAGDSDQLDRTLSEIFCADCLIGVLKVVLQKAPQITQYNWRPEWERQLTRIQCEPGK